MVINQMDGRQKNPFDGVNVWSDGSWVKKYTKLRGHKSF